MADILTPICKACGKYFPPRRGRTAANIYCSQDCSARHVRRRLSQADLLERARRHQRDTRPAGFDPGMVAFLIAMIGLCVEHASAACECWRAMALAWLAAREVRGVGAWI